jgi:cysteine desulfurase
MSLVYLDNCATTRPLPAVVEAMGEVLGEGFGNPSSIHGAGEAARRRMDVAREQVAALLGCRPTEVVFTSCATESINTALRGAVAAAREKPPRIVITAIEHEATIEIAQHLKRRGVDVAVIGVDGHGRLDLAQLEEELAKPTTLVSIMHVNNETGGVLPVEAVCRIADERGVAVHVDAVQAVGKVPLDLAGSGIDLLSLSGHKFHAAKGVGVLYVRRGARIRPLVIGASQESGRRGGTENVPGAVGLGVAAEHMSRGIDARRAHLATLSERWEERLLALPGVRRNGDPEGRVPGVSNLSFSGIEGSAIVLTAAREGVCLSSGSACSAAQHGGSHVLEAMGVPFEYLHGAVRFSASEATTLEEVDFAIDVVSRAVAYLRKMNPEAG